MNLIAYHGRAELAQGVAAAIGVQLQDAIAAQGRATLCVAGGTTPAPMFDILARTAVDWSKVTVLPTDERWVGEDDARSNAALVKKHLMVGSAQKAHYVSLYVHGKTPQAGLAAVTKAIAPHLPITVLLAGMGADLHTASLFPDAANIADALAQDAPPVMMMHPKSQPEARITLTAPVLRAALHSHIMITGADKRAALERLDAASPLTAPVAILVGRAKIHWAL